MVSVTCSRCQTHTIKAASHDELQRELAAQDWQPDHFNAGQMLCAACVATSNVLRDIKADVTSRTSARPLDVQYCRDEDAILVCIGAERHKFTILRRERSVMVAELESQLRR